MRSILARALGFAAGVLAIAALAAIVLGPRAARSAPADEKDAAAPHVEIHNAMMLCGEAAALGAFLAARFGLARAAGGTTNNGVRAELWRNPRTGAFSITLRAGAAGGTLCVIADGVFWSEWGW